jgi:ribonuclease HI
VSRDGTGLSLVLRFDGSVRYGPDNAEPRAAAIGYVAAAGTPLLEGSRALSTFVSSTHVEFRALVAGARAVAALARHRDVAAVHVRGDAAAVLEAVDPDHPGAPGDRVRRRRVETVREALAPIPRVTYRRVGRGANERAHALATRAHNPAMG